MKVLRHAVRSVPLILYAVLVLVPMFAVLVRFVGTGARFDLPPEIREALLRSLALAIAVGLWACVGGFVLGAKAAMGGTSRIVVFLVLLAILIPEVPAAFSLYQLFAIIGMPHADFVRVLLGQGWFPTALVTLLVFLRLRSYRAEELVATARILGANPTQLGFLLLRIGWPALLIGFFSTAAFSLQDVVYPFFLSSPDFSVVAGLVFSRARFGLEPWILWYGASILVAATVIAVGVLTSEASYVEK